MKDTPIKESTIEGQKGILINTLRALGLLTTGLILTACNSLNKTLGYPKGLEAPCDAIAGFPFSVYDLGMQISPGVADFLNRLQAPASNAVFNLICK